MKSMLTPMDVEKPLHKKDLEALLQDFLNYGEPWLHVSNGKWRCNIEMHVMSKGAQFEVKSELQDTPINAVIECRARMLNALKNLELK